MCQTPRHRLLEVGVIKITHSMALNFHPIFILLNHLIKRILDFGLQPPARRDFGFVVSLRSIHIY